MDWEIPRSLGNNPDHHRWVFRCGRHDRSQLSTGMRGPRQDKYSLACITGARRPGRPNSSLSILGVCLIVSVSEPSFENLKLIKSAVYPIGCSPTA